MRLFPILNLTVLKIFASRILLPIRIQGYRSPFRYSGDITPRSGISLGSGILFAFGDTYRDLHNSRMHTGVDLDPRMHAGIMCHTIPVCILGSP